MAIIDWGSECCEREPTEEGIVVHPDGYATGRCARCKTLTPFFDWNSVNVPDVNVPPILSGSTRRERK